MQAVLADLGAEVLKVEDTGMGDYVRWTPPYVGDEAAKANGTAHVQNFNGAMGGPVKRDTLWYFIAARPSAASAS